MINGTEGKLYYRGYSIEDLAKNCTFEEVVYLLLYENLPKESEIQGFSQKMRASRDLSPEIIDMIRSFPKNGKPMELLQSVVSYLSSYVDHKIEHSANCNCRDTLHQVVQLTSVVAAYKRIREGKDYIPPRMDLSHGSNFLYMLSGEVPDDEEGEMMDKALILHAEHGFNASTFTARVVASTMSTCYCSISAAIGALYGTLHGGANERVLKMLDKIGNLSNVESWVDKTMEKHQKIMGMGHRVYKAKDPRAFLMEEFLKKLSEKKNNTRNFDLLKTLEMKTKKVFEAKGKQIYPNVDFFSGALYDLMGIPSDLFTPIFAMSRVSGWLTHILEQRKDNRLYRPKSLYTGPEPREFVPLQNR